MSDEKTPASEQTPESVERAFQSTVFDQSLETSIYTDRPTIDDHLAGREADVRDVDEMGNVSNGGY